MKFSGKTEDADVPILKSVFWTKGTSLTGKVKRRFETEPEPGKKSWCFEIGLSKSLTIDASGLSMSDKTASGRQTLNRVVIGESAGLAMAIKASGANELKPGDVVEITCLGTTDVGKGSNRVDFNIDVDRPETSK